MPPKAAPKVAKAAAKPAAKAAAPKAAAAKPAAAPKKAAAPAGNGTGVYVKGLQQASVEQVKAIFAAAGEVSNVALRRNKYALVWFTSNASVNKAISTYNNKELKGSMLSVAACKASPKACNKKDSKVVYCSPLFRGNTTRTQARAIFADCGKISKLRTYRNNGAYIYFADAASAAKAIAKNGSMHSDKKLLVKASCKSMEGDKKAEAARRARGAVKKAIKAL